MGNLEMSNIESDELMSVISEVFAPTAVAPDSTFDELGANSLHLLRLMNELQGKYDIYLDVVDMFSVENVGDLIQLVEARMNPSGVAPA